MVTLSDDLTVKLSEILAKFKACASERELKSITCELASEQGHAYELDQLKDELGSMTAWQQLLLFMSQGLFGRRFTREEMAELTGSPIGNIHATCGSARLIRAGRLLG